MLGCQEERTIFSLIFTFRKVSVSENYLPTQTNRQGKKKRIADSEGRAYRDKPSARRLLKHVFNQGLWVNSCEVVSFSVAAASHSGRRRTVN